MKVIVHVDPTRCRGHGICTLFFADGLELDRWGFGRPRVRARGSAESGAGAPSRVGMPQRRHLVHRREG